MSKNEELHEQRDSWSRDGNAAVCCAVSGPGRRGFTPLTAACTVQSRRMQNLFMAMGSVSEHSGTLGQVIISFNSMFFDLSNLVSAVLGLVYKTNSSCSPENR